MNFKPHVGIDVGSYSIKLAQLAFDGQDQFKLVTLGQLETPVVEDQKDWLASRTLALKNLVKEAGISTRQVAFSLPESQVYTRVVQLPYLEEGELSGAISWQAEQYIPVSLEEVTLRYQVLSYPEQRVPGAKMDVLLVAAPNVLLNQYLGLMQSCGLEVSAIETEVLSTVRSVVANNPESPTTLLVHLGAQSTSLAVLNHGSLVLIQNVLTGGDAVTRAVMAEMGLERRQAEQYKKSYGLDEKKLGGRLAVVIKPVMELILSEARWVLAYYQSRGVVDPVKRAVLSGGGALLPGLIEYFAVGLGIEAQIGDPFANVTLSDQQKAEIESTKPSYAVCLGLAGKQS